MSRVVGTVRDGSKERDGELLRRMLTIQCAQAVGADKEVGSIEVGKKANFIVVNKDLSLVEFDGAQVLRTISKGSVFETV